MPAPEPSGATPADEEVSPCGLIRIRWAIGTGLMSHEIHSARFFDAQTGAPLLSLVDEAWDCHVAWQGEGRFRLSLRNYARPGTLTAMVDVPAGSFRLEDGGDDAGDRAGDQPLSGIDRDIRKAFAKVSAAATAVERTERPLPHRPPVWAWLAIAVAILAAFYLLYD